MLHIRIDENSQQAKEFVKYAKTLPFVEIIEDEKKNKKSLSGVKSTESHYDKDFVKKIQASRKSKGVAIRTADLWK